MPDRKLVSRQFFFAVRYWSAFTIVTIGAVLTLPGEALIELGRWIGSRSKG